MKSLSLVVMIEAALMAAFALILDLLPSIDLSPSISISFSMVPIFILAFRRGVKASLLAGFVWGVLQVALGNAWIVTPVQMIIEYFIAFTFIGFAGVFVNRIQQSLRSENKSKVYAWIIAATVLGSAARYFWHFIAGFIFFKEYAPEGMSPILFSLFANGVTMLGSAVLCSIVLVLLIATAPRLIRQGVNAQHDQRKAS
ncbi:energy-coupled thiamine transporter ThiT [[Bacillus] enclensis]|jgi:thiamine transporter|uniref:Thiamine transporter n=1 Tax=[Bacillus] enclensis TaxID=1402860 RepID=A0A0V8HGC1_9BACI|nr:energy-coupled thiamine transporter ThiT [[Bacillus] enclensis]QTC41104.1 energy-coupled thiamine transporter ThiT [Bacillus sp. V3]QWC23194.1 energy-coupled thiamine transporter ThiT [Bacillus haikouensis]KSU61599.1 energy-coupled thiamine transporter ThiT [[Bacillus] enclensis]MBH9967564.1 energy-coupled thiamine transporter ThiT [[Bacillus] enclensis]SCC19486.1 thiamine transporter [[Bacillus] enclensis]